MTDRVRTVLGDVPAEDLGIVLMHEHILWDLRFYCELPPQATMRKLAGEKVNITNLGDLRRNPFAVWDNLLQDDVDLWDLAELLVVLPNVVPGSLAIPK